MDKARQEQVIIALKEKGATQPCPRCRNLEFEVIGETVIRMNEDPTTDALWGVPVILVSCGRCGYIAHHAKALLGIKR